MKSFLNTTAAWGGAPRSVLIVTDAELSFAPLTIMVRATYAASGVSHSYAVDFFHSLYCALDRQVTFLNASGEAGMLEMRHLDYDIGDDDWIKECPGQERLRDWFRGLAAPIPKSGRVFVRQEARERFRIVATLLIAAMPDRDWPRLIAANNNEAAANDRSYDPAAISPKGDNDRD